jgi:hypothetical protein
MKDGEEKAVASLLHPSSFILHPFCREPVKDEGERDFRDWSK